MSLNKKSTKKLRKKKKEVKHVHVTLEIFVNIEAKTVIF